MEEASSLSEETSSLLEEASLLSTLFGDHFERKFPHFRGSLHSELVKTLIVLAVWNDVFPGISSRYGSIPCV